MNYDIYDIELRAKALIGDGISDDNAAMFKSVCRTAAAELASRLYAGVQTDDIAELFADAAAILAVSLYSELNIGAENAPGYIRAGSLTLRADTDSRLRSAAVLRKRAEIMLASYLKPGDFSFAGVDG